MEDIEYELTEKGYFLLNEVKAENPELLKFLNIELPNQHNKK